MKRWLFALGAAALLLLAGSELAAQARVRGSLPVPKVSRRAFVGGSARVTVTGSFTIDAELAINAKGSFGDGEMTYIGFGLLEGENPEAVITYGDQGIGLSVGQGKNSATAEPSAENAECSGEVRVTASSVAGHYTCTGVGSYDPATGKVGNVNITIRFTATSVPDA